VIQAGLAPFSVLELRRDDGGVANPAAALASVAASVRLGMREEPSRRLLPEPELDYIDIMSG